MKRWMNLITLTVAAVVALAAQMPPANSKPVEFFESQASATELSDSRIRSLLEELGIQYEVGEYGDFRIVMRSPDGKRAQVAYISSQTNTLGDLEIREIFSPAYVATGSVPAPVANRLLQDSANVTLGAWQTLQDEEHSLAVFTARIDADLDAETLQTTLHAVLDIADSMEAELTGDDYF